MHDESRSALAISRALEIKPGAAKVAFPIRRFDFFPSFRFFRHFNFFRHSGESWNLRAAMDSGFRRKAGLPAKPPAKQRGAVPRQRSIPGGFSRKSADAEIRRCQRSIPGGFSSPASSHRTRPPLPPQSGPPPQNPQNRCRQTSGKYVHMPYYRLVGEKFNARVPNDHCHHHQQPSRNGQRESVANDHISRSALGHPVGHSGPCYRDGETEHQPRKSLRP